MLTANVRKIKKNVQPSMSEWAYFLRSKNDTYFKKTCFEKA